MGEIPCGAKHRGDWTRDLLPRIDRSMVAELRSSALDTEGVNDIYFILKMSHIHELNWK